MKSYIKRDVKDITIKCKVWTLLKSQFKQTNYQKPVEEI